MTLNDLLQECARNTYNSKIMLRGTDGYTGKGLAYALRFLSGINYAIAQVSREKTAPSLTETVTLDEYGCFDPETALTKSVLRIRDVAMDYFSLAFKYTGDLQVQVNGAAGATVSVTYLYMPDAMTMADLDVAIPVNETQVDPHVICQYADYQFLSEEGTDYDTARAQVWLGLYNSGFTNISKAYSQRKVKVVYG